MTKSHVDIICLESEAFYALIDEVVGRIKEQNNIPEDRWIDEHEAMKMLRISSKTTMQKYRDERLITYSQLSRKVIVYDRHSIVDFLDQKTKHAQK